MLRWVCLHATKYSSSNTSDFIFPLFDGLSRCHQQDLSLPWFASANFWKSAYLFSFFQKPLIGIACLTTTSLICLHLVEMFSLPTLTSLAVLGGVGAECVKLMKGNIVIRWKKTNILKHGRKTSCAGELNHIFHTGGINHQYEPFSHRLLLFYFLSVSVNLELLLCAVVRISLHVLNPCGPLNTKNNAFHWSQPYNHQQESNSTVKHQKTPIAAWINKNYVKIRDVLASTATCLASISI